MPSGADRGDWVASRREQMGLVTQAVWLITVHTNSEAVLEKTWGLEILRQLPEQPHYSAGAARIATKGRHCPLLLSLPD